MPPYVQGGLRYLVIPNEVVRKGCLHGPELGEVRRVLAVDREHIVTPGSSDSATNKTLPSLETLIPFAIFKPFATRLQEIFFRSCGISQYTTLVHGITLYTSTMSKKLFVSSRCPRQFVQYIWKFENSLCDSLRTVQSFKL